MTQKELSYLEDAIHHEESLISICEEFIKNVSDENLAIYFEDEVRTHSEIKNRLLEILEVKSHG